MRPDPANASTVEIFWSVPALLALVITLFMLVWARQSFEAIRAKVKAEPMLYRAWGPRWNFSLLLLLALVCFGIGWLGYLSLGGVAMLVPPPISQANQKASTWFAWLLIAMETTHACAQGLLWAALRSLAGEPIIPRWRRAATA